MEAGLARENRGQTTGGSAGLAGEPWTPPRKSESAPVKADRGQVAGRRPAAVAARGKDRHLDHRVVTLPAHDAELRVDEVVFLFQVHKLVERTWEHLRGSVGIPVGTI